MNSGTSGLHLLIRAYGIGDGDEVITTPFSFIASSNCILYERARPVFVDIGPDTANIDVTLMEEAVTPRAKAVLAVDASASPEARRHPRGGGAPRPGVHRRFVRVAGFIQGKKAGGPDFAHAAVPFYPNKQITTGEGGLIVTDDDRIAQLCDSMCNQGRRVGSVAGQAPRLQLPDGRDVTALGVVQMGRLDEIIERRARVAAMSARGCRA